RARVGFFGHNAPASSTMPKSDGTAIFPDWDKDPGTLIWNTAANVKAYTAANAFLERSLPELLPRSWAFFQGGGLHQAYWVEDVVEQSLADFALSGRSTGLRLRTPDGAELGGVGSRPKFMVRTTTAHVQSERLTLAELPIVDDLEEGQTAVEL